MREGMGWVNQVNNFLTATETVWTMESWVGSKKKLAFIVATMRLLLFKIYKKKYLSWKEDSTIQTRCSL